MTPTGQTTAFEPKEFIDYSTEKLIIERSGHISSDGVQEYERMTAEQQQFVSEVMGLVPVCFLL